MLKDLKTYLKGELNQNDACLTQYHQNKLTVLLDSEICFF
jgi:hypothetical protein